jgi:hypothetical protein
VAGKLIRQRLKSDVFSIAKLRLTDIEKNEREAVETRDSASKGRMTFGEGTADKSTMRRRLRRRTEISKKDLDSTRRILTLPPRFFTLRHGK